MRTRIWLLGAVVLVICILLVMFRTAKQEQSAPRELAISVTNQPNQPARPEQPKAAENRQTRARTSNTGTVFPRPSGGIELSNEIRRQMHEDWYKPIEFYGKVVDENSNAVAQASIQFQWADMTENVAANTSTTKSDAEGLFSLHGKLGRSLEVTVSKEGYYASHGGYRGFLYSLGNDIYSPDPQNPVIFNLHKKGHGQGVELITSENGIRLKVDVRIPKDNTPVRVDLLQKQASASGQLEISQIKPPWQAATNWSFRMSIPDGGFVENQDEFQFEAPETNYEPVIEYRFQKGETNWTSHVTKQFYIAFGQPRKYGWLRIESNLAQETVFLTYAINPDGSRNLEPLEVKPSTPVPPPWAPQGTKVVVPEFK